MSTLLLRTLTAKSIIGFGKYKDITVQNLLDLHNHKALLEIYYLFRNIDFCKELKEQLCIYGEREIDKKDRSNERYNNKHFIGLCLFDIINKQNETESRINFAMKRKEKARNKKNCDQYLTGLNRSIYSKGAQRSRNQWFTK